MELRGKIMTGNLLIVVLILQFCLSFQHFAQSAGSSLFSYESSSSSSTSPIDRLPCVFRGDLKAHKEIFGIGRCVECMCNNGTTTCRIESCAPDPRCEKSERVINPKECCPRCPGVQSNIKHEFHCFFGKSVILQGQTLQIDPCTECTCGNGTTFCEVRTCLIPRCHSTELLVKPGKCCARCQSTTTVRSLSWNLTEVGRSFYGKNTPIRLNVDIEFKESDILEGAGMWRVGIFGSSDPAGGIGQRYFEVNQTLNEIKAGKTKTDTHMNIRNIRSDFPVGSIGCDDVRYFCVEFAKGDSPNPPFIMRFDNDSDDSSKSLISCEELICSKRNMRRKVS